MINYFSKYLTPSLPCHAMNCIYDDNFTKVDVRHKIPDITEIPVKVTASLNTFTGILF